MEWTRAGDRGLFLDLDAVTSRELHEKAVFLRKTLAPAAVITGHSSLLLLFEGRAPEPPAVLEPLPSNLARSRPEIVVPLSFDESDSLDLPEVLERLRMSKRVFIDTLLATKLEVRFLGFLPGFAYLDGLPAEWNLPRRLTSRLRVPEGSLGLAAGMAGFYPRESPGGWNVVGRSNEKFWDESKAEPGLFKPGDVVSLRESARFAPATDRSSVWRARPNASELGIGEVIATCISPGQRTLIVAQPKLHRLEYGLAAGGAFDAGAAMRANRRVGNEAAAAVLECTLVGPEIHFQARCSLAWEGASIAWQVNDRYVAGTEMEVEAGDRLRIGRFVDGLRGWLAFGGGGLEEPPAFSATPSLLVRSDFLRCGASSKGPESFPSLRKGLPPRPASLSQFSILNSQFGSLPDRLLIQVMVGPHGMADHDLASLFTGEWIVTPALDRIGIRLRPSSAAVTGSATLPSAGMQFGSVQLHPNGELVIMGPDHPITGGYLQPLTVVSGEGWKLAQLKPEDRVRFEVVT